MNAQQLAHRCFGDRSPISAHARIGRRARRASGVSQAIDPALVQHRDAIRQRERLGHVVRHEQHGAAQRRLQPPELGVQLALA